MRGKADPPGPNFPCREFLYRDYRLFVAASGRGWRVFIHAPGSAYADPETPGTADPDGFERVLAEARALIDRRLSPSG